SPPVFPTREHRWRTSGWTARIRRHSSGGLTWGGSFGGPPHGVGSAGGLHGGVTDGAVGGLSRRRDHGGAQRVASALRRAARSGWCARWREDSPRCALSSFLPC
ncbi:Os11g0466966, partial [Oryza sativa Japonica Group]